MIQYRSGNPALTSKTFKNITASNSSEVMTLDGTVNKISIGLLILLMTAFYSFSNQNTSLIWIGMIGGLLGAQIIGFFQHPSFGQVPQSFQVHK